MNKKTVLMSLLLFAVALPMIVQPVFSPPAGKYYIYCEADAQGGTPVSKVGYGDMGGPPYPVVKEQYAFKGSSAYDYAAGHGIVQVRSAAKLAIVVEAVARIQWAHEHDEAQGYVEVNVTWNSNYDINICWQGCYLYYYSNAVNAHLSCTLEGWYNNGTHPNYKFLDLSYTLTQPGGLNPKTVGPKTTWQYSLPADTSVRVVLRVAAYVDSGCAIARSGNPPLKNDP